MERGRRNDCLNAFIVTSHFKSIIRLITSDSNKCLEYTDDGEKSRQKMGIVPAGTDRDLSLHLFAGVPRLIYCNDMVIVPGHVVN